MKHGFAVIAIPETGLFVKDGQLVTGHNTPMVANGDYALDDTTYGKDNGDVGIRGPGEAPHQSGV